MENGEELAKSSVAPLEEPTNGSETPNSAKDLNSNQTHSSEGSSSSESDDGALHVCMPHESNYVDSKPVVNGKQQIAYHQCELCSQTFRRKDRLKRHLSTVHGEADYKCNVCSRGFSHEAGLNVHLRIHSGEKPYSCKECGMSFNQTGNLKTHMRKHTGETPYECSYCEKQFRQLSNLQVHKRIHTGEVPYSCKHCGAGFRQLCSLRSHEKTYCDPLRPPSEPGRQTPEKLIVKIIHPKSLSSSKIIFTCDHCEKTFTSRFALNRHSIKHTDSDEIGKQCDQDLSNTGETEPQVTVNHQPPTE